MLYAPGKTKSFCEPILGTTRLTKAFFLFEEELKEKFTKDTIEDLPEFIAWNYGPWSRQLIDDIEFFDDIKFIQVDMVSTSDDVSVVEPSEYKKLAADLQMDDSENLFEDETEDIYSQKKYSLTPLGRKYVEEKIWSFFSDSQQKVMTDFKTKINSISLFTLVSYVYKNYSKAENDWTRNSLIRDKVL